MSPLFATPTALAVAVACLLSAGEASAARLPEIGEWDGGSIVGTGGEPLPFDAVAAFPGVVWNQPVDLVRVPGSGPQTYLVLERGGQIWQFAEGGHPKSLFLDLSPDRGDGNTPELALGATFHPDYPAVPELYVRYARVENGRGPNRLSRFTVVPGDRPMADRSSEEPIIEWDSGGHRGGDLAFGADGMLYVSSGDGSAPGDPDNVGQLTDNLLGSILRLDVSPRGGDRAYAIPDDNPFVGTDGIRPEVWAYGLRNPWRMAFRPGTNELWLGDNGDEHWEMVQRVRGGENFGWSTFEGSHPFRLETPLGGPVKTLTVPVVEHPHQEMRSIIGGFWYRGSRFPQLAGHYLYGCHVTRTVWGVPEVDGVLGKPRRLVNTGGQIVSFEEDRDGEILVVTMDQGVFLLEGAPDRPPPPPFPALLSETGLFASTVEQAPAPGVLPYTINLPAFWNGATVERFLAVPAGRRANVQGRPPGLEAPEGKGFRSKAGLDRWQMPSGSVIFQTFSLPSTEGQPPRRIETQVSLNDGDEWRFLTYRWNAEQSDAELVPEGGAEAEIPAADGSKQRWRFASRAECTACHTQRSMFLLGVNLAQLNRGFDYTELGGEPANQLTVLRGLGILPGGERTDPAKVPVMPSPDDVAVSLEDRARAYLHVNCAHCHQEAGLGGRAQFDLLNWVHTDDLGVVGEPAMVGLPGADPEKVRLVVPGHPDRSELYRRMVAAGPGKMPLFGNNALPDPEGIALIRAWIESLPARGEGP